MTMLLHHRAFLLPLAVALPAVAVSVLPARAAPGDGASGWAKGMHTRARLVTGEVRSAGGVRTLLAGVHLEMDKGWKTYWRNPGDSGIPPNFDWSGSKNLGKVEILWPAPRRFSDPYGSSIGYKDAVVFPVLMQAKRAGEPVDLRLRLEYAICKDVCIPAEAALKLKVATQPVRALAHQSLIGRFLRSVPPKSSTKAAGAPSVRRVSAKLSKPAPHLLVEAEFPNGAEGADLFVEGPRDVYVPLPKRVAGGDGGVVRFKVDLTQADDPLLLKGKTLTLTLVSNAAQAETTWRLD